MKHSADELVELTYQFYPKGLWDSDPGYETSAEYRRLLDARQRSAREVIRFRALLNRLHMRFPTCRIEQRLYLIPQVMDACFPAKFILPTLKEDEGEHALIILLSILAPCYALYRTLYFCKEDGSAVRAPVSFELSVYEQPYGRAIMAEIETTFGYERMPPEIGNVIVPGACVRHEPLGKATLFDCLFTDHTFYRE
jgi:hypothetical protein